MERAYIKILAVVIAIALLVSAYGIRKLMVFERELSEYANNENNTNAKMQNKNLGNCRNVIKSRDLGKIPFLVKSIKYRRFESNEAIVFECFNQILEYNVPLSLCVFYSYECDIGAPRLDSDACETLARKAVYSVFSSCKNFIITNAKLIAESDTVCTFSLVTSLTGEKTIGISIRRDTGSVILYDAREAIDILRESMAAISGNLYGKL